MGILKRIFTGFFSDHSPKPPPDEAIKNDIKGLFAQPARKNYVHQKKAQKKEAALPYKPIKKQFGEPTCPYCEYRFEKFPPRKRKCPKCKKQIHRIRERGEDATYFWLATEAHAHQYQKDKEEEDRKRRKILGSEFNKRKIKKWKRF